MKAGKISLVPPEDDVLGSAALRVEVLDEGGRVMGHVDVAADVVAADKDQAAAIELFAFNVEQEPRMDEYRTTRPPSEGEHNRAYVRVERGRDYHAWRFRLRRGRGRYEGVGPDAPRDWSGHQ